MSEGDYCSILLKWSKTTSDRGVHFNKKNLCQEMTMSNLVLDNLTKKVNQEPYIFGEKIAKMK